MHSMASGPGLRHVARQLFTSHLLARSYDLDLARQLPDQRRDV